LDYRIGGDYHEELIEGLLLVVLITGHQLQ
jgi:hypothetical protein